MVDHWPKSFTLSEVEQYIIKEHRNGNQMYLSDSEKEMVQLLRKEREAIVNEQNEKSPNQQAVELINKLCDYFNCMPEAIESNILTLASIEGMNKYQNKAAETAIYPAKGTPLGLIYCSLKLCGEAGEVSENVGKALRDDNIVNQNGYYPGSRTVEFYEIKDDRRNKLKLELGDVLWYVSQAAKELGFTLEEIAEENLNKLASRKEKGTLKGSGDER